MPDGSIDTIIADPPYFTGMTHGYGDKARLPDLNICKPFYLQVFAEMNRVLTDKGCLYWFCDWRSQGFYLAAMEAARVPVKNCLVWDKGGGVGNFYTFNHELILFATFNSKFACKGAKNVLSGIRGFTCQRNIDGGKVHPSQKVLELICKLITDSTNAGDTVLDPFAGSATTGVACVNLNRNFIGYEIDERYFEIAQWRIDNAISEREQSFF